MIKEFESALLAFLSFFDSLSTSFDQLRFSSRKTPRYFIYLLGYILFPLILIFKSYSMALFGCLNIKITVFAVFNAILLHLSQVYSNFKSILSFLLSFSIVSLICKRLVSSAKWYASEYIIAL